MSEPPQQRMSSHILYLIVENRKKAPSNFIRRGGLLLYLLVEEEIPWQGLYPSNSKERPSYFWKRQRALFASLSTRRRFLALFVRGASS